MSQAPFNFIFLGTSEFAATILEKLAAANYSPSLVVTQPDRPKGRKQTLTPPPVKSLALDLKLPIIQPEKLDDNFNQRLKDINPDLIITAAYGEIIPSSTLNIPAYHSLNVHPSLLPKYRGASPIQTALLAGQAQTGITLIQMDEKLDHGPIITSLASPIDPSDTYPTLSHKLARIAADLLIKTIPEYTKGNIKLQKQDHAQATLTKIIKKEDGLINPDQTAQEIYNMYRAYTPWPGVFGQLKAKQQELTIKLIAIELIHQTNQKKEPLELFNQDKNLYLQTADTPLKINRLQPIGKNAMAAASFINGYLS